MKTIEVFYQGTVYALDVPVNREIRTKHGLFLTVDIESDALIFTQQNYNRMLQSLDVDVVLFRTEYKETLEKLARDNTPLATYLSLAPEPTKEEFLMKYYDYII